MRDNRRNRRPPIGARDHETIRTREARSASRHFCWHLRLRRLVCSPIGARDRPRSEPTRETRLHPFGCICRDLAWAIRPITGRLPDPPRRAAKRYGHERASIFQAGERWGDPAHHRIRRPIRSRSRPGPSDHRIRRPIRSRSRAGPSDHRIRRPSRRGDGPVRLGDGSPVALGADLASGISGLPLIPPFDWAPAHRSPRSYRSLSVWSIW